MKIKIALSVLFVALFCYSASAKKINPRKIKKLLASSAVMSDHYVGFALYDLDTRKMIFEQNSDKYFTPASNTKLYTFFTGLKMLKDSIPGVQYIVKGDSLIFWGTGDPSLLHPDFPVQPVIEKLKAFNKKLYYSPGRYKGEFYGYGWPYGDYNDYYQPEISELPLYGNIVRFKNNSGDLAAYPPKSMLDGQFSFITDKSATKYVIRRDLFKNAFMVPTVTIPEKLEQDVPYKTSVGLTSYFLKQNLPNYAGICEMKLPADHKTIYSFPRDTIFRHYLLPSDNFMAEQLLLACAAENGMVMSTDSVINYSVKHYMQDLPDKPVWVDGSGLSRHDLFTPRDMVKICEKIYDEVGDKKRLFDLLPQGGKTGTIRNLYKGEAEPYVIAKTGSLSNNHNLTGFLITKEGKLLLFSFMNNNFTEPTSAVRNEMERILTQIHNEN